MGDIETVDIIKSGGLNYEQLIARAVDRCLFTRSKGEISSRDFIPSVIALRLAIVDIPNKPMKSDLLEYIKKNPQKHSVKNPDSFETSIDFHERIFEECTNILAKYGMLFRSTSIEVGGNTS